MVPAGKLNTMLMFFPSKKNAHILKQPFEVSNQYSTSGLFVLFRFENAIYYSGSLLLALLRSLISDETDHIRILGPNYGP